MSPGPGFVRWRHDGWTGWLRLDAGASPVSCVRAGELAREGGRRSRHARTAPLDGTEPRLWAKHYPAPDGRRAARAAQMCVALRRRGFDAPEVVLVGRRGRTGLLVTRDTGGVALVDALAAAGRPERRRLLERLGAVAATLHRAGFVHGDLVPTNVRADESRIVLLDHDRTRHDALLVWWQCRRNLVQLGRFVVPGVGVTDRARVLRAYARERGLSRRGRHRLARWIVAKTIRRRCAIDRIPMDVAARAGFATLMRSGGPFDPVRLASGGAP